MNNQFLDQEYQSNNPMVEPPERLAAPSESLTEQTFIERSLIENKFWLRIMKEHALFLGEGFNRKDKQFIQQTDRFHYYFEQQEQRAYKTPNNVQAVRKLNEDSIDLAYGFRNFKRNLLILIINCKVSGLTFHCWLIILPVKQNISCEHFKNLTKAYLTLFKTPLLVKMFSG